MIVSRTVNRTNALRLGGLVPLLAVVLFPLSAIHAQDVKPLPTDVAQKIGTALVQAAAAIEKPQVKIEGDPTKAVGVAVPEERGIVLVPQKGMDEETAPDMTVATGVPLGLFFSSAGLVPVIDGQLVDRSKLYTMSVVDDKGDRHEINYILLTVRKISDEDYRLYGFGKTAKPLIDAKFAGGEGPGAKPLALEIKEAGNQTAWVIITVFGKYQAKFQGGDAE